jgi:hypothetical protein
VSHFAQMEQSAYRDHIADNEEIPEGVEQLLQSLERQGWWVNLRRGSRFRYWCPCPNQHNAWVEIQPVSDTYATDAASTIAGRSCFTHHQ